MTSEKIERVPREMMHVAQDRVRGGFRQPFAARRSQALSGSVRQHMPQVGRLRLAVELETRLGPVLTETAENPDPDPPIVTSTQVFLDTIRPPPDRARRTNHVTLAGQELH